MMGEGLRGCVSKSVHRPTLVGTSGFFRVIKYYPICRDFRRETKV